MSRSDDKIRILVSGAPIVCCDAIAAYLSAQSSFVVLGNATTPAPTAEAFDHFEPDIILLVELDCRFSSWLSTLRELAKSGKDVRTILLTYPLDNAAIWQAVEMGARGFLPAESRMEALNKCIRCVMAGEYWVGRDRTADLLNSLRHRGDGSAEPAANDFGLTAREKQIIHAVLSGLSNKEIAVRFAISGETVKHHLSSIFQKVRVTNRVELTVSAIENPLLASNSAAKFILVK